MCAQRIRALGPPLLRSAAGRSGQLQSWRCSGERTGPEDPCGSGHESPHWGWGGNTLSPGVGCSVCVREGRRGAGWVRAAARARSRSQICPCLRSPTPCQQRGAAAIQPPDTSAAAWPWGAGATHVPSLGTPVPRGRAGPRQSENHPVSAEQRGGSGEVSLGRSRRGSCFQPGGGTSPGMARLISCLPASLSSSPAGGEQPLPSSHRGMLSKKPNKIKGKKKETLPKDTNKASAL